MLFVILLFLIQACRCELGQFRVDEAVCKESYEQCISEVYCWGGALMCEHISKLDKTDDRTWCLVDKRCRKRLEGYKRNDKISDYVLVIVPALIIIFGILFTACAACAEHLSRQ